MNDRCGVAVAAGVLDVVVDRMVVRGDRLERRGVGFGKGRLGARKMSPTLRSSNVRGSTTVKAAGSNWSWRLAGWVINGSIEFLGGSRVIAPDGEIVASLPRTGSCGVEYLVTEIKLAR